MNEPRRPQPKKYSYDYAKELLTTHLPIKEAFQQFATGITVTPQDTYATFIEKYLPHHEMQQLWDEEKAEANKTGDASPVAFIDAVHRAVDLYHFTKQEPADDTAKALLNAGLTIEEGLEKECVLPAFLQTLRNVAERKPVGPIDRDNLEKGILMLRELYANAKINIAGLFGKEGSAKNVFVNSHRADAALKTDQVLPGEVNNLTIAARATPNILPPADSNAEEEAAVQYAKLVSDSRVQRAIFDGMMPIIDGLAQSMGISDRSR
jgi:hypothetical protein